MRQPTSEVGRGTLFAFTAYGLWGLFPLYFHVLIPASAWEIFAHRIVWSLLFCVLVLAVRRDFGWLPGVLHRPKLMLGIALASMLIAINWLIYVAAVVSNNVQEASLGYFLNPLVTVALGVVVLRESLRRWQWIAVGIGVVAAVYLTITNGRIPYVALVLAFSFAGYGLLKKRIGDSLEALHGLALETAILTPFAIGVLVYVARDTGLAFGHNGAVHTTLLVMSGIVTAIPLLLFAAAARRVPLVTIGLIQFLTPIMQLLIGVLVLGEHMPLERWVGFAMVWLALIVLSVDSLRAWRAPREPLAEPIP